MKKILGIILFLITFTVGAVLILTAKSNPSTLYLLNWGEYINEDLVAEFEQEYNCTVVEEIVTSSETMYQKITAGTTAYDVAIPGDYMITKLQSEGYLKELDVNNPKYENIYGQYETMFTDSLQELRETYMPGLDTYCMPYFWGAYSIIYNTQHSDVEEVLKSQGFKGFFDRSLYQEDITIGMYNTARWCISCYMMAQGLNPNTVPDSEMQELLVKTIKAAHFDVWGDDVLKRKTATGSLDMCYTQLGDFFDALYLALGEGLDINSFNVLVPETTAAFFDGMVIPTTGKEYDLANAFINFMLDPEHALENAEAIGYCPTLKSVVNMYYEMAQDPTCYYYEDETDPSRNITMALFLERYPVYLDPLVNSRDSAGHIDTEKVFMLEPKDADYMTLCETLVNQIKASADTSSHLGTVICLSVVSSIVIFSGVYIGLTIAKHKKKKEVQ